MRKEIAEAELADGAEESSDEDDDEEPDRAKELMTARDEILRQIECVLCLTGSSFTNRLAVKHIQQQCSARKSYLQHFRKRCQFKPPRPCHRS